jgi:diguanylate cyclase (GGDEF)-like protein/PAS domain S-box-containing protein
VARHARAFGAIIALVAPQVGLKLSEHGDHMSGSRTENTWRPYLVGGIAFALALAICAAIVLRSQAERLQQLRTAIAERIADKANDVESDIERALTATYALAALVRQGDGIIENFDAVATEMLPFYPGIASLQLAPGGVIRHIVPLEGNEKAIGHDLLADPARTKEAFLARDSGKLTLAGPFELIQGGLGAVGRLPVFLDGPDGAPMFWGFTTVLIRFPEVLDAAQLPQLVAQGLHYQLWRIHPDSGDRQVIASSTMDPLSLPVERDLQMPNGLWTLSVTPVAGWRDDATLMTKGGLGLLFSLMLAWLAKQMTELRLHRRGLQSLVAERTAELAAREMDLNRAQAVARTGSWVFDRDTSELRWSVHALRIFGVGEDVRFKHVAMMERVHPDDRALLSRAWQSAMDGASFDIQHRIVSGENTRWVRQQAEEVVDSEARTRRIVGTVQDITERKQVDERMREAMVVFEASSQGIMTTDAGGIITSVNPAFCAITGFSDTEVVGRTPSIFKSGRHDAAFYQAMWTTLAKLGRWEGEIWNRRKNGEIYPQWLTISTVHDEGGKLIKYVSLFSDITRRKEREEVIWRQANFDSLTGLANRNLLLDRLERALAHARRGGRRAGLIFLDLDGFKWINDSLGHDIGDELLIEVASRLRACVREQDTVARLGGDEFTLVADDLDDAEPLRGIAEKVLAVLRDPFELAGASRHISGSVGITVFPDDGNDVQTLLRNADIAMYQSKQLGKNRYQFYAHHMQEHARARMQLEAELRDAIAREEFVVYFQPIVDAGSSELIGAEALIRWQHPERGMVSPQEFIPVAEDTGLIVPIGEWVLREAAQQCRNWNALGYPPMRLAVNVSGVQFRETDFRDLIERLLVDEGMCQCKLLLEITESVLMDSSDLLEARMREIQALGVGFSLDDFGTGYSSLSYLKRFPVDIVKIDRSFVNGCPENQNDARLVETIVNMAHSLGMRVTAEGVETEAQRNFLRALRCDYLQGYLISRPVPASDFEGMIKQRWLLPEAAV